MCLEYSACNNFKIDCFSIFILPDHLLGIAGCLQKAEFLEGHTAGPWIDTYARRVALDVLLPWLPFLVIHCCVIN